jgi:raffinose/stachyose/melibiose transport system permease protein
MTRSRYFPTLFLIELGVIVLALLFFSPFYFVISNSVKPYGKIIENAAAFPHTLEYQNYITAWTKTSFPRVLLNSLMINTFSVGGMVFLGAMAAWRMVRRPHRLHNVLFILFVSAMVIPFQSVMIPMVKISKILGLLNSIPGIIVIYWGFGMPLTVFLLHGFVKAIPRELEEAAYIDGANTVQVFFLIVFPLMRSIIVTVIILQTLWIWNDFLLPLLVLFDKQIQTIPLAIFSFFGQYLDRWDYALATLIMGMIPVILFFLFLQKHIIKGITAGSVKG